METPFPPTRPLYDSRRSPRARGIGFPSCNTELALIPANTRDPHGYYAELGVAPSATPEDIRSAVRRLLHMLHPDTGTGDVERLQLIQNIAIVLLDPISRDRYNRTPEGMRLMDAVYAAELSKIDELTGLDEEGFAQVMTPTKANPYRDRAGRFDFLAHGYDPYFDPLKAQMWYHYLVSAAPTVSYRQVIKVLLTDGPAHFDPGSRIMSIPRRWDPSFSLAYALFTHVAGFVPGVV